MINPHKKRFYWLKVTTDLLGTWCLVKLYGGLFNNHRHEVWLPFAEKELAYKALTDTEVNKQQRGYIYSDNKNTNYFTLTPQ